MKQLRNNIIRAGLSALYATGAHHILRPMLAGIGTIFMLHHVRPAKTGEFQPNRHLEITPDFLRATLAHVRALGIDIVAPDEMHRRLSERDFSRRFACFTFDDGYRDNRDHALPAMQEFDAPMAVYVASDFAEGRGRLWWVALEMIVAKAATIEVEIDGVATRIETGTVSEKYAAFARLHNWLRELPTNRDMYDALGTLCARYDVDQGDLCRTLCLDWQELRPFAAEPLVTIGAHTISHCILAKQSAEIVSSEMRASRERLSGALQCEANHLAYPYGDKAAAGSREFAIAQSLGFKTAVTTRPGMIFPENAAHLTALPRLSLNGNYQDKRFLPVLTSGAATAMWNGFRRIDAA